MGPGPKWDSDAAQRYETWLRTPMGAFALSREKRLLMQLMSSWPRRGQRLLEVGCGVGVFLEMFWEAGFDITGLDLSPDMLAMARARIGSRADLHLGSADHLPFEDKEYDYVTLITVLEFTPDPAAALAEAFRVARKGLLVAFLNKRSLYYCSSGVRMPFLRPGLMRQAHWFSPQEMRGMLQNAAPGKSQTTHSVLPGPCWTWKTTPPWRWLNAFVLPCCLGAWCATRVDFYPEKPLTPLYAFNAQPRISG